MPVSRIGLLIVRVWVEEGSSEPLRAHIRLTTDVSSGFEDSMMLSRVSAVCQAVETWLGNVLADSAASST